MNEELIDIMFLLPAAPIKVFNGNVHFTQSSTWKRKICDRQNIYFIYFSFHIIPRLKYVEMQDMNIKGPRLSLYQ